MSASTRRIAGVRFMRSTSSLQLSAARYPERSSGLLGPARLDVEVLIEADLARVARESHRLPGRGRSQFGRAVRGDENPHRHIEPGNDVGPAVLQSPPIQA